MPKTEKTNLPILTDPAPIIAKINEMIAKRGRRMTCAALGISDSYLSLLTTGKRPVTETIANFFGYTIEKVYVPMGTLVVSEDGKIHGDQIGEYLRSRKAA